MSRIPRLLRLMHTEGRRVPNPGQGGAAPQTSISPTPHSSHLPESGSSGSTLAPSQPASEPVEHASSSSSEGDDGPHSSSSVIKKFKQPKVLVSPLDPSMRFTAKGKLIPHRPARTVPVQLPSGFPEPDTYPPSAAYLDSIAGKAPPKRHPLWQFFRVPESAMQPLTAESTAPPVNAGSLEPRAADDANLRSGRSWSADELRQKSFADLHTLWYVLLQERNLLATQGFEYARLGINPRVSWELIQKRSFRCRKAMARIKYVLNERRLGLIAATNPLIERPKPKLPWSALPTNDPAAGVEALRGEVPAPTHILRTQSARDAPVDSKEGELEGEADRTDPVVPTQEVAKQEVEARDEGFGGGNEAKEFVQEVEVKDGHVQKKD